MSERVLHEWTDSESIIRIVEDDRGFFGWSAESGIVSDLIPIVFCKELARLDARVSELEAMYETSHASRMHAEDCVTRLEAEVAVLSGTACAEEQAEGNGPCGACRTCRNKRITELEAENAKLWKCVKAGDHYINSIYSITSNTGLLHAEWSEKIDYYAARAEVDK